MINENFFIGVPVRYKDFCLVYPPTVQDVIANENFWKFYRILTISQEDVEDEYFKGNYSIDKKIPTPFEYFLASCYNQKEFEKLANLSFEFFTKQKINFLYREKALIIGDIEEIVPKLENIDELKLFKEEDFFEFQNLIRQSIGDDPAEPYNDKLHPKIRQMKAKARERDKIKSKKKGMSTLTLLSSICCMGIGINPLNIGQLSYAAMKILLQRYQEKEKYDIDIKSILAGADSKKIKPQYWIKNLEDGGK